MSKEKENGFSVRREISRPITIQSQQIDSKMEILGLTFKSLLPLFSSSALDTD